MVNQNELSEPILRPDLKRFVLFPLQYPQASLSLFSLSTTNSPLEPHLHCCLALLERFFMNLLLSFPVLIGKERLAATCTTL